MQLQIQKLQKVLNPAYRKQTVKREDMEAFKGHLRRLIEQINPEESEENAKGHLSQFLRSAFYGHEYLIATKERNDLVIHNGPKSTSPAAILVETKRPRPQDQVAADMIRPEKPNVKALHELILYFLRERIENKNTDLKYLIATDINGFYFFNAEDFERLFFKSRQLVNDYKDWRDGRKTAATTDFFYQHIVQPFIEQLDQDLPCVHLRLQDYAPYALNDDLADDKKLIPLYKVLSPAHLLRLPFANDSNSLNKDFYYELLHLIGLEEAKEGSKKVIRRKPEGQRNNGSLLENAIRTLETEERLGQVSKKSSYGDTKEEQYFGVALELCITWVNRVLFLKLLEAQLLQYHDQDSAYRFLHSGLVKSYDELNELFFEVLAKQQEDRGEYANRLFDHVPYLNSSLFEISLLESESIRINSLKERFEMPMYSRTVLKDDKGRRRTGSLPVLEYLFAFLDAYNFSSEGSESIEEHNRTLINASVLGLIFEKINGYKDGAFFTPGFITMYMCRETLRRATLQKFRESPYFADFDSDQFDDLVNFLSRHYTREDLAEANALINSLKICDPAVGSGHFLVSALNELLAIKSELGILCDRQGRPLPVRVSVDHDELSVQWLRTDELFVYRPGVQESQIVQEAFFHEKQMLIEGCLFGVDINPNSVKICRLRLWIELLKNAYYIRPDVLETLPNIDINIKQGNSLVSRFALDEDLRPVLKQNKWKIEDYRIAIASYQAARDKESKRELLEQIDRIKAGFQTHIFNRDPRIKQLAKLRGQKILLENKSEIGDLFEKLSADDVAQDVDKLELQIARIESEIEEIRSAVIYRDAFEWRFEFPEVLNEEGDFVGFDVVVGNPPYIRIQDLFQNQPEILDYYNSHYFSSGGGNYDIYILFIELGLKLINTNGELCFIIPHKFMNSKYGKKIRNILSENRNVKSILHFGHAQIFADATTYTGIFSFTRELNSSIKVRIYDDIDSELNSVSFDRIEYNTLSRDSWELLIGNEAELLEKLSENKYTLEALTKRIFQGIKTSLDKVFILEKLFEFKDYYKVLSYQSMKEYEIEKGILYPLIKGGNSRAYQLLDSNLLVLFPYSDGKLMPEKYIIDHYPNAWKYLYEYKRELEGRERGKFQGEHWYMFGRNQAVNVILSQKLFTPDIAPKPRVSFDFEGKSIFSGGAAGGYGIIPNDNVSPYLLLAILNSKVFEWYISKTSTQMRGGWYSYESRFIRKFPIPSPNVNCDKIVSLAEKVCRNKLVGQATIEEEIELNLLVCKLYSITYSELMIIDPEVEISESDYFSNTY